MAGIAQPGAGPWEGGGRRGDGLHDVLHAKGVRVILYTECSRRVNRFCYIACAEEGR